MTEADSIKWALLDLLKVLDVAHGGRLHPEFARIAGTLGVVLPVQEIVGERDPEVAGTKARQNYIPRKASGN